MSKKKSAKKPARATAAADAGNGRHHSESSPGNGADRVGETPHPAANGGAEHPDPHPDLEMEEGLDMLPERVRRQLESIRRRSQQAQDLSREARDSYESARKTLEKHYEDSKERLRQMEEKSVEANQRMDQLEEQYQKRMEETREQNLRLRAEAENIRKRAAEQMENIRKYAVESFAAGVCEIRDCLEAAMQSPPDNPEALREGVRLTLRKLASVMDAHGLQPVNPDIAAPFDPALHQAVAKSADAAQPRNTVAAVVRKGYTIHERVLRPADVVVSIRNGSHSHPTPAPTPAAPAASAKPDSVKGKKAKKSAA